MNITHNPATFLTSFISISRNVLLSSSIVLGILVYSPISKLFNETSVKKMAFVILLFSILYGLKGSYDFHKYINYMQQNKKVTQPYIYQVNQWKGWIYLLVSYIILLTIGLVVGIIQMIKTS